MLGNAEKLLTLLSGVFKVDARVINDESSPENIDTWDSFNTLKMIMEIENEEVFTKKNLFNRLKIIINYWRYCFHGEIPFFEAKKKWIITKNNNFLIIFFIFSFFLILKDICLNKVVKTHQEFNKNILKSKINSEKFF